MMNMENTYLFKQYLMTGRGKAYLMATDDSLKYAEVVLEACKWNIAFDIQSEGSRAFLIADIVDLYNDRTPFVQATIDEYVSPETELRCDDMQHLADLLSLFDRLDIIEQRFDQMLNRVYSEADSELTSEEIHAYKRNMEYAVILLVQGYEWDHSKVVFGRLAERAVRSGDNFADEYEWLIDCMEEEYGKEQVEAVMKDISMPSESVDIHDKIDDSDEKSCFLTDVSVSACKMIEILMADDIPDRYVRSWARRMSDDQRKLLAEEAVKTSDAVLRTKIVSLYDSTSYPWPQEAAYLINWCSLGYAPLRYESLKAMRYIESDEVREYALAEIEKTNGRDLAGVLIRNYRPGDESVILPMLNEMSINMDNSEEWHKIGSIILDKAEDLPKEFLYWMYESTMCSFCRKEVLDCMLSKGEVPEQYLEECEWDANLEIRELVLKD